MLFLLPDLTDLFWSHAWPIILALLCTLPFILEGGSPWWLVAVLPGGWVLWRVGSS